MGNNSSLPWYWVPSAPVESQPPPNIVKQSFRGETHFHRQVLSESDTPGAVELSGESHFHDHVTFRQGGTEVQLTGSEAAPASLTQDNGASGSTQSADLQNGFRAQATQRFTGKAVFHKTSCFENYGPGASQEFDGHTEFHGNNYSKNTNSSPFSFTAPDQVGAFLQLPSASVDPPPYAGKS